MVLMSSQCNAGVTWQEPHTNACDQGNLMQMTPADQTCFANALLSPPQANSALQRAMARHTDLIRPME